MRNTRKSKVEKCFAINDGVDGIWPLSEMLECNESIDPEFCEWAKNAQAGDSWSCMNGELCTCVGLSRQHGM